ncbi:RXT2 domain-containing protein [Aspergillus foveolatus]|uniref:RXT2 domain-containing protein n=1 Tax=Aspergillus foveolatus TaxID=210207 RepID=UPI003CCD69CD
MAAQAALIADTIVGMKRALRNENDFSGPDDPITQPTNRGNKLRGNARFVKEGAMSYIHAEGLYKKKIEHAGYTRYILHHNPVRYDSEGDELDDDDEDSEADAAVAEENPFSEIALEHFLCPLKHPSELPSHPSLSHAYTSKALSHMTQAIEAKLRQERALLWRARNLHRQLLGDGSWAPCGLFETPEDRLIFEPQIVSTGHSSPLPHYETNGVQDSSGGGLDSLKNSGQKSLSTKETESSQHGGDKLVDTTTNVEMEVQLDGTTEDTSYYPDTGHSKEPKFEEVDTAVSDLPQHSETREGGDTTNGGKPHNTSGGLDRMSETDGMVGKETRENGNTEPDRQSNDGQNADEDVEMENISSPEPPRRMTTRAQTNAGPPQHDVDSRRASPSASSDTLSSLPTPHPLYLVPESVRPDPNFGLPPNEAEDTRRLLWSYVQKQEETVRGLEHMLESLLRACRMKEDVFEWCKAEGHVGELSDGEDWYDREKWGLAEGEDLKKGADEDDIEPVEESRSSNKRGRGRRA